MQEIVKEIYKKVEEYDTIMIHRHRSPDIDCVGSQMALKGMLKLNFPNKKVFAVGDNGYEQFTFLGEIDFPSEKDYKDALVICVDVANYARIEDQKFRLAKEIIKIDHHQDVEEERFGVLNLVEPSMSSTCELLYMVFEEIKTNINSDFMLDEETVQYIFAGIFADTGGFIFPNTQSNTFRVLSEIRKYDFEYEELILQLRVLDEEVVRIIGWALQHIEITDGVGVLIFDQEFQEKMKVSPKVLSIVVNYMGMFGDIKAWVVFNEYPKFIRVNLRSRHQYDISKIAVQYNGGGHKNASGAMINSWEDKDVIVEKLLEMVK